MENNTRTKTRRRRTTRPQLDNSVPSPCIGVCWLNDETGWCEGCLRDADEIRDWIIMDRPQKLTVLDALTQRREQLDL